MGNYICETCGKSLSRKDNLHRHCQSHLEEEEEPEPVANHQRSVQIPCKICNKMIRGDKMENHMIAVHVPWIGPTCEDMLRVVNPNNVRKPKKCPECHLYYLNNIPLKLHLHSHGLPQSRIKAIMNTLKTLPEQQHQHDESSDDQEDDENNVHPSKRVRVEPGIEPKQQGSIDINPVPGPSSAIQEASARPAIDIQQALKDLDLENINFSQELELSNNETEDNNSNDRQTKYCKYCKTHISSSWERHVLTNDHKDNAQIKHSEDVYALDIAFGSRIIAYRIYNQHKSNLNYSEFLNSQHVLNNLINLLTSYLRLHSALKFQLILYGQYIKQINDPDEEDEYSQKRACFQTSLTELLQSDNINDKLNVLFDQLIGQTEDFTTRGSGWALSKIEFIEVHINKYAPLRGGTFVELPQHLIDKNACYNPIKNDDYCFKWVVRGYFRHKELKEEFPPAIRSDNDVLMHFHRQISEMTGTTAARIDNKFSLNWGDIEFPIEIKAIHGFLTLNPTISITVYGISLDDEKTIVGPLFRSPSIRENHIHMLLLEENGKNHLVYISDLSRLLKAQYGGRTIRRELCENCLRAFNSYHDLMEHMENDCLGKVTILPEEGQKMSFKNHANAIKAPIICYADFESVIQPIPTCENNPTVNCSLRTHIHVASSYAFLIKYETDPTQDYIELYRGEDCTSRFVTSLYERLKVMFENLVLNNVQPMIYTHTDRIRFENATECHICKRFINGRKVRDHDHQTGKFRGAACDNCNKHYYLTKEVSVFFHNLSKYDAHLFIEDLARMDGNRNIEIIPSTDETYISFMRAVEIIRNRNDSSTDATSHDRVYLKVRFKDSFRFFPGSLQAQAANLLPAQYINTEKFLSEKYDQDLIELLKRKGVFPYEYIKSFDNYQETSLPPKAEFSTTHDGKARIEISDADYRHALYVYEKSGCQTIGEYNDLYLLTDILILADVFENFRNIAMRPDTYELDPAHYYTLPGFSWDAMLKYTRVELELLSDLKMVNFINRGIRGGLCQCSYRFAEANNKYLENYNPAEKSSYLIYLDVNNLYGFAMVVPLPVDQFSWLPEDEIAEMTAENILNIPDDNYFGYILQVDLEYPIELHDKHNDLPFCPEKKKFGSTTKLCATLEPKQNYIIHYCNLKLAIKHGLKLSHVHKAIKFHQSTWLAPYINLNNDLRTQAVTPAEKDTFKLCNNSIFGKSVENVMNRRSIYLCNSWESRGQKRGAEGYIASGYCKHIKVFNDSLVAVELEQKVINFNKPIYVGFSVMELSKIRMYQFHYEFMQREFSNIKICYIDTDSFIYFIETEDYYQHMKDIINKTYTDPRDIHLFDTSNYDPNNEYGYQIVNKKVLGAMKDETAGDPMTKVIAIRPKAYYYETKQMSITKKAKGVVRAVADTLNENDYMSCLLDREKNVKKSMRTFRADHHKVYNERVRKTALNGADDKRVIRDDGKSTYAYGHYMTTALDEEEEDIINFYNANVQ